LQHNCAIDVGAFKLIDTVNTGDYWFDCWLSSFCFTSSWKLHLSASLWNCS